MCKGPGARESLAEGRLCIDSKWESDLGPAQGCRSNPLSRASEAMMWGCGATEVGRSVTRFCFHTTLWTALWGMDWREGKRGSRESSWWVGWSLQHLSVHCQWWLGLG